MVLVGDVNAKTGSYAPRFLLAYHSQVALIAWLVQRQICQIFDCNIRDSIKLTI